MQGGPDRERSFFGILATVVKVIFVLAVAVLLALGVVDLPFITDRLAGIEPDVPRIGIISGHWQYDSGAVCPDGLQEVDLNLNISRQVVVILREAGYRVDMLPEYAPELNGYQADVLLSIHCDSCISLSGFKVARMANSTVPELEDELVSTLYASYEEATGLKPHLNTITEHMLEYHALRRIEPGTPGAIIECGFMGGDRLVLTEQSERVAVGIANGLLAFLQAQGRAIPTPSAAP